MKKCALLSLLLIAAPVMAMEGPLNKLDNVVLKLYYQANMRQRGAYEALIKIDKSQDTVTKLLQAYRQDLLSNFKAHNRKEKPEIVDFSRPESIEIKQSLVWKKDETVSWFSVVCQGESRFGASTPISFDAAALSSILKKLSYVKAIKKESEFKELLLQTLNTGEPDEKVSTS